MYGKKGKQKKKKKKKGASGGGGKKLASSTSHQTVTNDASQQLPNNDQNNSKPSLIRRSSSFQDFKVANAPRIAANTAAKIVTGVDMNGLARSQTSFREMEEQEQQRDFVHNSLGQPVYVGRNRNSIVEPQSSGGSGSSGGGPISPNNNDISAGNFDDLLAGVFTAPPPTADVGEPVVNDPGSDDDSDDDDIELSDEIYSHPQDRGNPFLVSLYLPLLLLPYTSPHLLITNHRFSLFVLCDNQGMDPMDVAPFL